MLGPVKELRTGPNEGAGSVSGSWSDFGKVSVSVPDLNPDPDPDHIRHSFQIKIVAQSLALLMLEAALMPRQSSFVILWLGYWKLLSFQFISAPEPNPVPDPNP